MMNTGEKIDYMIQCLKVAKAEYEYTADYVANQPTEQLELWKFIDTHRAPNKALIKDKNKLSESIEKLAEFEEKEKCGEWLDAIELAKIAIALQRQKWIPCSERLPKKPECGENGYIVQKKRVAEPFSAYWDGERWTNEDDDVIDEVMAWLPLPEPFKEEEHEQTN